jgi:hypothetical protein
MIFSSTCYAAEWYVDKNNDGGTENGKTWGTAWGKLTDIIWANIAAGDTIWISGGEYNQGLSVGASGSGSSGYIFIKPGGAHPSLSVGHEGKVYIDGTNGGNSAGISISSKNYIEINGQVGGTLECNIIVRDWYLSGIHVNGNSNHIVIKYIESTNNNIIAGAAAGVFWVVTGHDAMGELAYCKIHNQNYGDELWTVYSSSVGAYTNYDSLKIHHNDIYDFHADAVKLATNNTSFYNNIIRDRGVYKSDHPDGIQVWSSYIKIYNNEFYNFIRSPDDGLGNSHIRYNPDSTGGHPWSDPKHVYIHNNLFHETRTPSGSSVFRGVELSFTDPSVYSSNNIVFANNTIVGLPYFGLFLGFNSGIGTSNVSNIRVQNNIFKDASRSGIGGAAVLLNRGNGSVTFGSDGDSVDVIFDYNSVYASSATYISNISYAGKIYYYSDFKSISGCQKNDVTGDPYIGPTYIPKTQSAPIVNTGANLNFYFTTDKYDQTRGVQWDIGAYEFIAGTGSGEISSPQGLRIVTE